MRISILLCKDSPMLRFAASKLAEAIRDTGHMPAIQSIEDGDRTADIVIAPAGEQVDMYFELTVNESLEQEGFEIRREFRHGSSMLFILAKDESGAMYGSLEVAGCLRTNGGQLSEVQESIVNARFPFRALKFNLPWSSYRNNESFNLQKETVRDLAFWQRFLDMMAENRFNVLTLWNLHPFPFMLRTARFPKATPFTDEELSEWKMYWSSLFRMAKERGIETYMINWNIIVSEAFAMHYDEKAVHDQMYHYGDSYSTEVIKQYTRESITQLIDEYPDLTGFGIALGERMNDMTPQARQDWINDVYFEGMKHARRPIKFIHRAPFSVDPSITRTAIESNRFLPEPVWVEVKFNWSHAYSSPKLLLTHGGSQGMEGYWNPPPQNYKITWMVRNEDFFTLRWAQPDFIREHISENGYGFVGGYYVGSECFIPGKDYSHIENSPHLHWDYAFEKHWLYYMVWGRLLYDPKTPDTVFEREISRRYGEGTGEHLLKAYSHACKMPMVLASYYSFTWDFTLYAEGFIATNEAEYNSGRAFISMQDLLESKPFDPTYLSIKEYIDRVIHHQSTEAYITPLMLADTLEEDAVQALSALRRIDPNFPALHCEMADVEAWAHLSLYFADKLRAGVCYETFRRSGEKTERIKAVQWLKAPNAAGHWEDLVKVTKSHYKEQPLMHLGKTLFSWELFLPQILQDIDFVQGNGAEQER